MIREDDRITEYLQSLSSCAWRSPPTSLAAGVLAQHRAYPSTIEAMLRAPQAAKRNRKK